jgi:transposase
MQEQGPRTRIRRISGCEYCRRWIAGLAHEEVANLFGVPLSTIKRYIKRRREGEDLTPKPSPGPGRRRRMLSRAEEKRALCEQLENNDEATLERHCEL